MAMTLRARVGRTLRLRDRAWDLLWPGSERVPVAHAPGHFYSPIPSNRDIRDAAPTPVAGIDLRVDAQVEYLRVLDVTMPVGPRFQVGNGYYDEGDAAIYQAILRHRQPARVVEIGAGWSTAALFDADATPDVTVVDPDPSRVHAVLRPDDYARCTVRAVRLQDVELDPFLALGAGDVLFVDSTHVSKLGSDVNRVFFSILPRLAPGVAVHIHDVTWPFEYPEQWRRSGWAWNEAYLVRAFLQFNEAFTVMLWADMLHSLGLVDDPVLAAALDRQDTGCIWIERR